MAPHFASYPDPLWGRGGERASHSHQSKGKMSLVTKHTASCSSTRSCRIKSDSLFPSHDMMSLVLQQIICTRGTPGKYCDGWNYHRRSCHPLHFKGWTEEGSACVKWTRVRENLSFARNSIRKPAIIAFQQNNSQDVLSSDLCFPFDWGCDMRD